MKIIYSILIIGVLSATGLCHLLSEMLLRYDCVKKNCEEKCKKDNKEGRCYNVDKKVDKLHILSECRCETPKEKMVLTYINNVIV
uniref:Secreted protein n=1 Tax=Strongyloides papillosus TaxID=174720 RepID=A0A0N5BLD8_STREA